MLMQANRQIRLSTPLATDRLAFKSMQMTEALGRPYEIELEFYSADGEIPYDQLLGHMVSVELDCGYGGTRQFTGHVARFGFAGSRGRHYIYKATAVPWFTLLTLTENCQIFHNKNVEEIVTHIFRGAGHGAFEFRLTQPYPAYEYCVQYRESDFDFVSRLLEREGIYYFFEHSGGAHRMVLTDAQSEHSAMPGYESYEYFARDDYSKRRREGVYVWEPEKIVQTHRVALQDYDFKKPGVDLGTERAISRQHGHADCEVYDYPGLYRDVGRGESYARTRIEELQARQSLTRAQANLRGIATGHNFSLTAHPIAEYNHEYLVTAARYQLFSDDYESGGDETETFTCDFTALSTDEVFRPQRSTPRPIIPGPQTAVVVSNDGEEICVDEHGRVLVHFHWERDGEYSCWVRVSQGWAGYGWGAMFFPRVGHEVIVEFEEGDPDRPIITGRVYNGLNRHTYHPPDFRNVSSIRTDTVKGTGFNELRFNDTAGEEEIYVHAQKNMEIDVQNSRYKRVEYDDTATIGNNSYLAVAKDRVEKIDGNRDMTVVANLSQKIDGEMGVTVGGGYAIKTGGDLTVKAGGEIVLDASKITLVSGGTALVVNGGSVDVVPALNVGSASPGAAAIPPIPAVLETAAGEGSPFVSHCPNA